MKTELESKLRRIEAHAEVALGGIYPSVYAVHAAQAELAKTDVPYLIEMIRSLTTQLEDQKKSLQTIENVVNRWDNGELSNIGDGITWKEPVWPLPTGTDEIREALKDVPKNE